MPRPKGSPNKPTVKPYVGGKCLSYILPGERKERMGKPVRFMDGPNEDGYTYHRLLIGYYNEWGYEIRDANDEIIYAAGNHKLESAPDASLIPQVRAKDNNYIPNPNVLSLRILSDMCDDTLRETCAGDGSRYGGVEYRADVNLAIQLKINKKKTDDDFIYYKEDE